jgi:hypothetical protein
MNISIPSYTKIWDHHLQQAQKTVAPVKGLTFIWEAMSLKIIWLLTNMIMIMEGNTSSYQLSLEDNHG